MILRCLGLGSRERGDLSQSNFWINLLLPLFCYKKIQYKNWAIPIEVKSGHNAKLRSLHLYMDEAPHDIAVRVWSQPLSVDMVKTPTGKEFKLINIPFYYVCLLEKVLEKYS